MEALYQCAKKIAQNLQRNIRHKTIIRFGLSVYIQVWMYLTCQQQQKTWEQITPSLLNQNAFY